MANKFKVDLAGLFPNWSTDVGAWATTSGGVVNASHPTAADAVFFDGNSGACTVDVASACQSLNFSGGYTDFFDGTAQLTISGSTAANWFVGPVSSFLLYTGVLIFAPTVANAQVTFNGNQLDNFTVNASTGTNGVLLQDSCSLVNAITLTQGALDASAFGFSCASFSSSNTNTRSLTLGNSATSVNGTGTIWAISGAGMTLSAASSTIVIGDTSATGKTFAGGGLVYGSLTVNSTAGTGAITITGNNTFSTVSVKAPLVLTGTTQTITTFTMNAGCTALTGGTIVTSNAVTAPSGCVITNSTLSGVTGDGTAAVNGGGNSGWNFGATPPVANFTGAPLSGLAPVTVVFTDGSTGTPTSWNWDFGDGSTHATTQNPTHTYTAAGTYTVVLIATNAGGSNTKTRTGYIVISAGPSGSGSRLAQRGRGRGRRRGGA